jgi:hypothetical protein
MSDVFSCAWCGEKLETLGDAQTHNPCPSQLAARASRLPCPLWLDGGHLFVISAVSGDKVCACGCFVGRKK